jgi:hypothetical protein
MSIESDYTRRTYTHELDWYFLAVRVSRVLSSTVSVNFSGDLGGFEGK